MRRAVLTLAALVAVTPASAQRLPPGHFIVRGTTGHSWYCREYSDLADTLNEKKSHGERLALLTHMTTKGECDFLKEGDYLTLRYSLNGLHCVSLGSVPQCVWTDEKLE